MPKKHPFLPFWIFLAFFPLLWIVLHTLPSGDQPLFYWLALKGRHVLGATFGEQAPAFAAPLGLIGHMFVHERFDHLAFNMLALGAFGGILWKRLVADRSGVVALAGMVFFFGFFLACGMAGGLAFWLLSKGWSALIGASGAVAGCFAAVIRLGPGARGGALGEILPLRHPRVRLVSVLFCAIQFIWLFPGMNDVSWQAHLGGFAFGLFTYGYVEKKLASIKR